MWERKMIKCESVVYLLVQRIHGSRKMSTKTNLVDGMAHLQVSGSPITKLDDYAAKFLILFFNHDPWKYEDEHTIQISPLLALFWLVYHALNHYIALKFLNRHQSHSNITSKKSEVIITLKLSVMNPIRSRRCIADC
jgi:hypothetical protein